MKDDNKGGQRFLISELEKRIAGLEKKLYEMQQSRYHCQYLFRHNPLGMLTADKTGLIAAANPAFLESFGLSEQAVIGKYKIQSLPALKEANISPYINELLNNEKEFDIESLLDIAASGKKAWFRIRGRATGEQDDSFILIFGNITDRKLNEEKLKESEQRYRTLFEKTPDGIVVHCDGKIVFINPAAVKIGGGKSESDFIGKSITELVHPDSLPAIMERIRQLYNKVQDVPPLEEKFIGLDGSVIDVDVTASMIDFDGRPASQVVFRDISDRKRAEREIHKLSNIVKTTNQFVVLADMENKVLYVNPALVRALDYKVEKDIIGKSLFEFSDEQGIIRLQKEVLPALNSTGTWKGILNVKRKDGSHFPAAEVCSVIKNEQGQPEYLVSIFDDITELIQTEEALRRSDSRNRALLEAIPDLMFRINGEGKFIDFRTHNTADLCVPPDNIIGSFIKDIFPPELANKFENEIKQTIKTGKLRIVEYELSLPIGRKYYEARVVKSDSDEVVSIIRDVTESKKAEQERKKLEEQIQHTQKLESLGVLAGGIAHDFNNILTGVLGNAGLAQLVLSPASPAIDYIDKIETSSHRAAELCRQLLAYSGKGRFVVQPVSINMIIKEMTHLLEVSISKKAVVKYQLDKNLPAVDADITQIRQIIMNLILNAAEAIGDKSGIITLTTGAMKCDRAYLQSTYLNYELKEGLYVYLEVCDTGCGMDEETKERIFDPFFSTKFTGRGLGLAAVLGIMRGHNGAVKVYSEAGRGTTFKVLFPVSGKAVAHISQSAKFDKNWRASGTLLIVDDEDTIRALGRNTLETVGFKVLTAPDGREALKIFKRHKDKISLVLLDMTMPHMDGQETFRELRRLKPDVRVILSSGYNEQEATNGFVGKGLAGFLQKPYNPSDLIARVRKVLEEK